MTFFKDPLVSTVIGCAIEVHRIVGPGLLDKGEVLDHSYRIDFLIEDWLIVELKSVEKILPVHVAQVVTYLRLFGSVSV